MRENFKRNRAITLVSLVVTIVVLIILAGVAINLTLSNNGILNKAKQAKEEYNNSAISEGEGLNELYAQTYKESSSYNEIEELVEFKRTIASAITYMGIETSENASADTMASNIRSLSGAASADRVSYDNTNSGLTANNVQSAIDEVNNSVMTPFIDYAADNIAEILTYNGSWTATQDCACIAQMGGNGTYGATVYINGNVALSTMLATSSSVTYPYTGTAYVKKGQTVTTRNISGQKYKVVFKPLIK